MPFCPKCRFEYLSHVSECPDCEERLVAQLPPEPEESETWDEPEEISEPEEMESYDNWIPLARISSTTTAEMVLEALLSKDIPAILSDKTGHFGQTGQMGPSSFRPIEGAVTTLFVPDEFAADASQEARIILGDEWDKVKLGDFRD
jgi:hypothetical protein